MTILHALILSLIEGITEFLPVSSTGHMILVSDILKITQTEFVKSFEIIIQLGSILAVFLLYAKTFLTKRSLWPKIIYAFLPTGILGLTLYKLIKHFLIGNTAVVLISLLVGGIFLILLEGIYKNQTQKTKEIDELSNKDALLIGLFQSISMVPGVSRSAASIFGGMTVGLKRKAAVEFSFMLAIPTMVAATGLDFLESSRNFTRHEYLIIGIGFLGSFLVALFAVKFFLNYVQKNTLISFGIYRILLALLFWLVILH